MAFTDSEKAAIRDALGYSGVTTDPYFVLEGRMTAADANTQTIVRGFLAKLDALDTAMGTAGATDQRFKRVEDVEFAGVGGLGGIQAARDFWIGRISRALGVPVFNASLTGSGPSLRG